MQLRTVTLDCLDPPALAEFYRLLCDGTVMYSSPGFVYLNADPIDLAFQRADAFRPPAWPDPGNSQQVHLDFHVGDPTHLDAAQERAASFGATPVDDQPRPQDWRVMLDPAGHPFCLSAMAAR